MEINCYKIEPYSDLRKADLTCANLEGANLFRTNLDFYLGECGGTAGRPRP